MRSYVAVEIDGVLSPYGGPPPAGHTVHDVESAVWREWAAMVYPRPRGLRLALHPAAGRALADLPADLVLVSSYAQGELVPLLPALGWDTVPPMVPLRHTAAVHYLRVDDPGRSPDAENELRWRTEEIASWAQTHDRPVAWVRAGEHHAEEVRSAARSTGDVLHRRAAAPVRGRPGRRAHRRRRPGAARVGTGDGRAAGTGPGGAPPLSGLRRPGHPCPRRPPRRPRPRGVRLVL
ncbi:hypothetical protein ACH4F3_37785 [Streptomyces anulatus]